MKVCRTCQFYTLPSMRCHYMPPGNGVFSPPGGSCAQWKPRLKVAEEQQKEAVA